jgi:gamma-glutamylcysteine synthetase
MAFRIIFEDIQSKTKDLKKKESANHSLKETEETLSDQVWDEVAEKTTTKFRMEFEEKDLKAFSEQLFQIRSFTTLKANLESSALGHEKKTYFKNLKFLHTYLSNMKVSLNLLLPCSLRFHIFASFRRTYFALFGSSSTSRLILWL